MVEMRLYEGDDVTIDPEGVEEDAFKADDLETAVGKMSGELHIETTENERVRIKGGGANPIEMTVRKLSLSEAKNDLGGEDGEAMEIAENGMVSMAENRSQYLNVPKSDFRDFVNNARTFNDRASIGFDGTPERLTLETRDKTNSVSQTMTPGTVEEWGID
ncbi:MAG: hypothetical protein SV760_00695, partial [Halobacteria archaeon]|nr:hypothetical protein [Halobacteria archaeon]